MVDWYDASRQRAMRFRDHEFSPGLAKKNFHRSSLKSIPAVSATSTVHVQLMKGASIMRRYLIGILFFVQCSFAQVTIQGTVRPSFNQDTVLSDAAVQFFRLDVAGLDTHRTLVGSVPTNQSGFYSTQLITGVSKIGSQLPQEFELSESYPNPFDTKTQMGLQVPTYGEFSVTVFNILGQRMATVQRQLGPGAYTISWQGADIPGVYFAAVRNNDKTKIVKIIQLMRNGTTHPLQISPSLSGGLLAKRSNSQSSFSGEILQVTVSKSLYQTYVSPALTFTSQTVDAALQYAGSGTVSPERRDSSRQEIGAQLRYLNASLPKADAANAMVDWLKKQPQFEDAGTGLDGNVWARRIDGTSLVFINNPPAGKLVSLPGRIQTLHKIESGGQPSNIPMSNKFFYSASFGPLYAYTEVAVMDMCVWAGYDPYNVATVDGLKGVKDAGVYFEFGHGGYGSVPSGGSEYAVWTDTKCTRANDALYADDLKEHRLVEMYGLFDYPLNGVGSWDTVMYWKYAYTGQFVRKYMTFSNNSLAFIASCYSATNNAFVNAFFVKGASMFAGYTDTWYSDYLRTCVLAFFDRVIGRNGGADAEVPPQRPFDGPAVLAWMQSKNLDWGAANGTAKLVLIPQSGNPNPCGPLAPSIATMFVHPYEQKLYIYGIFGDNPGADGQVTINNVPSEILEWSYFDQAQMDRIICKIPDDGAGSFGDVQVTVRKIKSNITQLSRYKGNFRLIHETTDGRQFEMDLALQMRVHLLGFRMKPGDKPMFNQSTYVVYADMASTGEIIATGSTGGAVFWSGHNTTLHNNMDGGSAPAGFIAGAWFDPEQMKMQFYMSGGVQDGIIQTIGSNSTTMSIIVGLDEFDGKKPNFPSYAEIKLNSNFSITKGSAPASKVAVYYSMMAPMADKVRIEWDDIACEIPPKPATPR